LAEGERAVGKRQLKDVTDLRLEKLSAHGIELLSCAAPKRRWACTIHIYGDRLNDSWTPSRRFPITVHVNTTANMKNATTR
jgi:hypothetical protein